MKQFDNSDTLKLESYRLKAMKKYAASMQIPFDSVTLEDVESSPQGLQGWAEMQVAVPGIDDPGESDGSTTPTPSGSGSNTPKPQAEGRAREHRLQPIWGVSGGQAQSEEEEDRRESGQQDCGEEFQGAPVPDAARRAGDGEAHQADGRLPLPVLLGEEVPGGLRATPGQLRDGNGAAKW